VKVAVVWRAHSSRAKGTSSHQTASLVAGAWCVCRGSLVRTLGRVRNDNLMTI
jgi:hypothetical protein